MGSVMVAGCDRNGAQPSDNHDPTPPPTGATSSHVEDDRTDTDVDSVRNVMEYGAVGDGESDDRDAIQDAIDDANDGDTVFFPRPAVAYKITRRPSKRDTLIIDGDAHADQLTLEGTGPDTVVKMEDDPGGNYAMLRLTSPADHTVRIRNLVFDGNKSNVGNAWPSFCLLARDNGASGTGDVLVENVELRNSIGHGSSIQYGGVTFNRCTAIENRRHGCVFTSGSSDLHSPRPVIQNSLSKNNATGDGGYYNVDMSTGELVMQDCVLVGGVSGFKISDDARKLVAKRVRARDGSDAAFRSTGPNETTEVEFGDVIAKGFGSYFRLNGPEEYTVQDGTELLVSDCAAEKDIQIYITDSAVLDASNAAVYTNRGNTAVGLASDSSRSSTIRDFYHYENDEGPTGELANVNIIRSEERDKTDIEGVPTEADVGAWSRSDRQ